MSLFKRLERRWGRFAIPNLTAVLLAGQAILYVLSLFGDQISLANVSLNPAKVLDGEIWRLVTFLFYPPGVRPLFAIFYFLLFHLFGTSLENHWGVFRFNVFIFLGYLANVAAAFLGYAVYRAEFGGAAAPMLEMAVASNFYLYGMLMLAFARIFPDFTLNVLFVLPIRIKWLALIQWIVYGYTFLTGLFDGNWMKVLLVVASVANYLVFFGREHWQALKYGHRRRAFQAKAQKSAAKPRHVCRVCGLDSDRSPKTLFRYCSKCAGQACYCPDHIRDHDHVGKEAAAGHEA